MCGDGHSQLSPCCERRRGAALAPEDIRNLFSLSTVLAGGIAPFRVAFSLSNRRNQKAHLSRDNEKVAGEAALFTRARFGRREPRTVPRRKDRATTSAPTAVITARNEAPTKARTERGRDGTETRPECARGRRHSSRQSLRGEKDDTELGVDDEISGNHVYGLLAVWRRWLRSCKTTCTQ